MNGKSASTWLAIIQGGMSGIGDNHQSCFQILQITRKVPVLSGESKSFIKIFPGVNLVALGKEMNCLMLCGKVCLPWSVEEDSECLLLMSYLASII